ncbi:MAG TPA: mechanosensitive ion channel domain-containing protein [Minicystis sp.]|nr:mechanosensitive ion channel domain-containing protein [Minicystis sp.]
MPPHVKEFLDYRLVSLAGGVVTPGSILVAAGVLFVSILVAALAGRSVRRILAAREVAPGMQFAAAKITRYVTIVVGALVAVNSMGFELESLVAASAVLAVGIGFGLQNIAQNFISGVILLIEQPVRQGDFVKVGETLGVVDDIGLRATRVVTRDEVTIIVPNSQLITAEVVNHSRPTQHLRIHVSVGVAYGSDTRQVRDVLLDVARADARILPEPVPEVRFDDFGDSALKFTLLVWIAEPRMDRIVASDLRFAIDDAFRKANIEMPFPQSDVHIRSGLEALKASRPDRN